MSNNQTNSIQPSNSLTIAMATIFTTYIIKTIGLDSSLYGVLYPGICFAIDNFNFGSVNNFDILKYFTFWNILGVLIAYSFYKSYQNICIRIVKYFKKDRDHNYVCLYIPKQILTYMTYIKHNPNFYDSKFDMQYGDPELILKTNVKNSGFEGSSYFEKMATYKRVADEQKINFKDTNFGVEGYYIWKCNSVATKMPSTNKDDANKEVTLKYPFITIYIKKTNGKNDCININKYFDNIVTKVEEIEFNNIIIWHVKILRDKDTIRHNHMIMYEGKKKSTEELEKIYIEPFFHKDKQMIWKIAKEIQFNPTMFYKLGQAPRIGMLLYGPPGTGKSSIVYKLAMALDRHVISMDLRSIKSKYEIYKFMRRPEVNDTYKEPKDVIFVFDEFDLTVRELHAKKKKNDTGHTKWKRYIDCMTDSMHIDKMESEDESGEDIKSKDTKSKDTKSSEDSKNIKKKNNVNHGYQLDNYLDNQDELTLEDLLEIFQGPVPLNGSIIIATTNKYEEIKKLCPALFRPGRLTPILFDNIDNKILSDMVKYYYEKDYTFNGNISEYSICPSYVIQIITESKLNMLCDSYEYFIEKLNDKINELNKDKLLENSIYIGDFE